MTLTLTEDQCRALALRSDDPLRLIDPTTDHRVFVLLPADVYERVRPLLSEEFDIREAYAAEFSSALRAGWADPGMEDYDNYDEAYRKLWHSIEGKSS